MAKRKIYISGPVSGLAREEAARVFDAAEKVLRALHGKDAEISNPMTLCGEGWTWEQCMRVCLMDLTTCDEIVMLPGWKGSRGARLEHLVAQELGLAVTLFGEEAR